jgi:two-component system response regulator ChvI
MELAKNQNIVMLVDNEPDVIITFKAALQEAGLIVHAYEDPLVALSNFKPRYYDLVILDIKMPKMNGFELYAEMQKIDNQVRVCFVTAGEMYYDKVRKGTVQQEYCELDSERFILKPISNAELINRVGKLLMTLNKSPNIHTYLSQ